MGDDYHNERNVEVKRLEFKVSQLMQEKDHMGNELNYHKSRTQELQKNVRDAQEDTEKLRQQLREAHSGGSDPAAEKYRKERDQALADAEEARRDVDRNKYYMQQLMAKHQAQVNQLREENDRMYRDAQRHRTDPDIHAQLNLMNLKLKQHNEDSYDSHSRRGRHGGSGSDSAYESRRGRNGRRNDRSRDRSRDGSRDRSRRSRDRSRDRSRGRDRSRDRRDRSRSRDRGSPSPVAAERVEEKAAEIEQPVMPVMPTFVAPMTCHRCSMEGHMSNACPTQGMEPTMTVEIPQGKVGYIVGKGGSTIQRIKRSTTCAIDIDKEPTEQGTVAVKLMCGDPENAQTLAQEAVDIINKLIAGENVKFKNDLSWEVPDGKMGRIIGAGGSTINYLRDAANCEISLPPRDSDDKHVVISSRNGIREEAEHCLNLIKQCCDGSLDLRPCSNCNKPGHLAHSCPEADADLGWQPDGGGGGGGLTSSEEEDSDDGGRRSRKDKKKKKKKKSSSRRGDDDSSDDDREKKKKKKKKSSRRSRRDDDSDDEGTEGEEDDYSHRSSRKRDKRRDRKSRRGRSGGSGDDDSDRRSRGRKHRSRD